MELHPGLATIAVAMRLGHLSAGQKLVACQSVSCSPCVITGTRTRTIKLAPTARAYHATGSPRIDPAKFACCTPWLESVSCSLMAAKLATSPRMLPNRLLDDAQRPRWAGADLLHPARPPAPAPPVSVDDVLKLKHDYESKREAAI
jgi:hypothetical protein